MVIILLALFAVLATANAAYDADEILSLPGWDGSLPSKQYSGYLDASSGSKMHYWLVESENDPATSPTVLWFNGGPGCSSLDGFIYEHGPFVVSSDAQTLTLREYRWNLLVNMLYIEAPVGVGFSYSETGDYKCDDDRTALENYEAVQSFFEKFPEFKTNKFFITGESYAGVYVPTLAEAIVNGQKEGSYTGARLTGIAAGNGCSGTEVGICGNGPQGTYYEWQYLLQTAFIATSLKNSVNSECDWEAAAANKADALSAKCVQLLNQASAEISNVNLYDIYGDCVSDDGCSGSDSKQGSFETTGKIPARFNYEVADLAEAGATRRLARIIPHGPEACIDSKAASAYLNQPAVMKAIHVRDPGFCWGVCNSAPGWSYQSTRTNLPANTYPLLVSQLQVVIFNGDWDACVPYTDGEGWTGGMGLPVSSSWHPWTYTSIAGNANQVAGYATAYDVSALGSGSFEFVTVKGGRHEVPESAPAQAFELLTRLIEGTKF
jgi:hypothetical protein